jgi:P pilus assembly chaperone PapD
MYTTLFFRDHRIGLYFPALSILFALLAGCGGGGGAAAPPPGDFSISASLTSLTLDNGQNQTVTISVGEVNNFTSSVNITVSGLPTGVTATPSTFNLAPGGQQQVTLAAAATAPATASAATVVFQGASGGLSHSAQVSLSVVVLPADFSIKATPASLSVDTGGSQNVTVSVAGTGGFASSVSMTVSGLPAGVTATPAKFSLTPGNQQVVALNAAATATAGATTVTFQGTSGSLSHSAATSLSVVAAVTGMHAPIRTRALRTNASTLGVDQYNPPRFTAYDSTHRQFFVSNPNLNEVDVFSAANETETAKIPVPGPWGLDFSPFDGNLYVGTMGTGVAAGNLAGGDIYVIDASTLAITQRYPASTIGPSGFAVNEVLALSGGLFALTGIYGGVGVWDPVANTLDSGPPGTGETNVCYPVIGPHALSGDRTRILVAGISPQNSGQLCSYDPVAKQATIGPAPIIARAIIPTPDGSRFFTVEPGMLAVFDAKTLQLLGQNLGPFNWNTGYPQFDSGVISADSRMLYASDYLTGAVGAFDATTLAQVGWVPSPSTTGDLSDVTMIGIIGAIDETGLIVGPIGGGVEFIDAALKQSNQPTYMAPLFPQPETGPLSGGTVLNNLVIAYNVTDGATLSQIYIGNTPAQETSFSLGADLYYGATATTPPSGITGTVDTTVILSDGAIITCMECFSYGPSIIELVSNGATAEGGGTGLLVGFGFGGNYGMGGNSGSAPDVSVRIGGQSATVLAVLTGPPEDPYPFDSSELIFTIPPGTAGTAADVTVTTSYGSVTASGAFHYVAATQTFPLSDTLQQGVYDARRDLYYFVGKSQIQVLSQTLGKWLSPIPLPGVVSSTQLLGIAESPDGSKLAVSDQGGQAIYVLNPDNPASAQRFSLLQSDSGSGFARWPNGLAITNAGMVYFANNPQYYELMKLDTSSGLVTPVGSGFLTGEVCQWCRAVQSPDGRHIYGINGGLGAFWVDLANDQVTYSFSFGGGLGDGPFDLAVSGDRSTVAVNSSFADPSLNFESTPVNTDWEWFYPGGLPNGPTPIWATTLLDGEKLNGDGSILFLPLNNGIDLYARNTGRLLYRVQIPVTPASNFDPLVLGKGQNVLAVITANGVSIVDMSSLPVAAEYTQPFSERTQTIDRAFSSQPNAGISRRAQPKIPNHSSVPPNPRRPLM